MECQDYGLKRTIERENLNLNPLQRVVFLQKKQERPFMNFQTDTVSAITVPEGWMR
jgi:Cys-tRNA synthase (O-phospho-L-seryl-tRNA:Cys-tRNA synthase)